MECVRRIIIVNRSEHGYLLLTQTNEARETNKRTRESRFGVTRQVEHDVSEKELDGFLTENDGALVDGRGRESLR